jgi:hypothetical protein
MITRNTLTHPDPRYPYPGAPPPTLPDPETSSVALASVDPGTPPVRGPPDLASDLLEGAGQIAAFMGLPVRTIYRLSTEVASAHRAPFFKLGGNTLCARRSVLLRWIAEKERARLAEAIESERPTEAA